MKSRFSNDTRAVLSLLLLLGCLPKPSTSSGPPRIGLKPGMQVSEVISAVSIPCVASAAKITCDTSLAMVKGDGANMALIHAGIVYVFSEGLMQSAHPGVE